MSNEQPYDPYIPSGGQGGAAGAGGQNPGNQRTAALQAVSHTPIFLREKSGAHTSGCTV